MNAPSRPKIKTANFLSPVPALSALCGKTFIALAAEYGGFCREAARLFDVR